MVNGRGVDVISRWEHGTHMENDQILLNIADTAPSKHKTSYRA
jgi:hypothetical protein